MKHEAEESRRTCEVVDQLLGIFAHMERGSASSLRIRDLPLVARDLVEERRSLRERLAALETEYLEIRNAKESATRKYVPGRLI